MPSIQTIINAIKTGDSQKVDFFEIPHDELQDKDLLEKLISTLEQVDTIDTLTLSGSELTPEQQKRINALILFKTNLRNLFFSAWEMDGDFLNAIIQKPLKKLGFQYVVPPASMSSIIATSKTLEEFSIAFSNFTDADAANIMSIKTLKIIYCRSTELSIKSLVEFISLNQLEKLEFNEVCTQDDLKLVEEALRSNTGLEYLSVELNNESYFIHDRRPTAKKPKMKIISIMEEPGPEMDKEIDNAFALHSGSEIRNRLLELGYNPNTYVGLYYKRNEINPVLNLEIANEQHARAIKIIEAFPELDPTLTDWEGKNALHIACKTYTANKVVLALIQHHIHKLDLNARDNRGCTPLHYLCAYGKVELVQQLIKLGARLDVKDKLGRTPLDYSKLPKEEVEKILDSIAICPFRDTKAPWSGTQFVLPTSYIDSQIPYCPGSNSHVFCFKNVQASLEYVSSEVFKESYQNQKMIEQKRLKEVVATLSGKSVIDECLENQKEMLMYLSTLETSLVATAVIPLSSDDESDRKEKGERQQTKTSTIGGEVPAAAQSQSQSSPPTLIMSSALKPVSVSSSLKVMGRVGASFTKI